jgi:hypothetical protein
MSRVTGSAPAPSFVSEVGLGFVLSLVAATSAYAAALILPPESALRAAIAVLGIAYTVARLIRTAERTGRVVVLALWAIVAGATWLFAVPLTAYVAIHVALIWLIRSLFSYSSLLAAALDLALTGLSLGAATWAFAHSDSVFLACWCLLLVQALHTAIPTHKPAALLSRDTQRRTARRAYTPDRFGTAHRAAEAALQRLAAKH